MKVGLFYTCLVNIFDPRLADKAKEILEFFGYEVFIPESQTCCAQPNFNSGDFNNSQELSKLFINELLWIRLYSYTLRILYWNDFEKLSQN